MALNDRQHVWRAPLLYPAALISVAALYCLVSLGLYVFGFQWWGLPLVLLCIHYGTSLNIVPEDKLIGIYFVGIPTIMWSAGPILLPWLLFRKRIVSFHTFQREFPGDPENLFLGDGDNLDGKKRPIRITFANPNQTGEYLLPVTGVILKSDDLQNPHEDPLHVQVTADYANFYARYRVGNVFDTARNLTSEENEHGEVVFNDEIDKQLEDTGTRHMVAILSKIPLAVAKVHLDELNAELAKRVIREVGDWGVEILAIDIKIISLAHSLNGVIQQVSVARATATATVVTAEAARTARIKQGQGEGAAQESILAGQGEGLKKKAAALGLSGEEVIAADVAIEFARGSNKTIIAGAEGLKELGALATAFLGKEKS